MTTAGPDDDTRARRPGVSVRTRLTVATALLVALSLASAGLLVYTFEDQRRAEEITAEIDQEFAELDGLRGGLDPETREPFVSPEQLLRTFLARNVPDDTELLAGWWDGSTRSFSFGNDEIVMDPSFDAAVGPLLADNGTTVIETPEGRLQLDVQTVRFGADGGEGALVVGTFLDRARSGLLETMRTYTLVALVLLLLVTAVAAWLSGRLLAPLRTLRTAAESIGETDLSQRIPERGNDDITALTRTVNGMLGRLETAFVAQRQFLDDAGHELRTPLTVLSGHLELLDPEDPAEVRETQELLLDEIDRMSRLVRDLMLLAKSERPDFLHPEPVRLHRLVSSTLAKATAMGPRDWRLDASSREKVVLDQQRIAQALLQLADNAVKHTAPGQVVALGADTDGDRARLWVRDTGRGVPAADRGRIFERFGRSVVPRGDEGFGLGLSIVGAIAAAHHGSAHVEDGTDDQGAPCGARFVITLPLVQPDGDGDDSRDHTGDTRTEATSDGVDTTDRAPFAQALPPTTPDPTQHSKETEETWRGS
ncbi:ATPase [Nocardioides sp. AX2bis]|nr:ATPase [Nocardioides sp. AX2bis]